MLITTFTIDDLGNREKVNVRDGNGITYTVDNLTNRYTSIEDANLTYDAAGNLTQDQRGYEYEYDYENRIVKITKDGNDIAEFAYDALGRRMRKIDSKVGHTTYYYNNYKWQVLYETGTTGVKIFFYGNYIDEVLFRAPFIYYVHDHLYSPVALVSLSGTVLERYEYDAYGEPTIWNVDFTTERDTSNYGNPYLFTGRRVDILDSGSLKIQYNRNRYYDYYTGRWLTHDPLGITPNPQWPNRFDLVEQYEDGLSLYEYSRSEPLTNTDPWGLLVSEKDVKEAMYNFARKHLIRKKHWRDLLKAWYYEKGNNPVIHEAGQPTVKDIKANAGFRLLSHCWVAKYIGCLPMREKGKHFKLHKKYFFWHYYYPDPMVPGGLAAYEDATNFLGSYTAFVKALETPDRCSYVDLKVTVANRTSWESASRTLKFFTDMFPSYPSHRRGAGPFTPSRGGDFYQRFKFTVKRIPVIPTRMGTMSLCWALR